MARSLMFWTFLALDGAALALMFVLGLAAAQPSHTNPLAVVGFFALPAGLLLALAAVFLRAPWPAARTAALLVVAAPVLLVLAGAMLSHGAAWLAGERGDGGGVALQPVAAGASTARLEAAIRASGRDGAEPVRLLLAAGADLNHRRATGPVWFDALSPGVDAAVLPMLLDAGANLQALDMAGGPAMKWALFHRNWAAAALLLERGAAWKDVRLDPPGTTVQRLVADSLRARPGDADLQRLERLLRAAAAGSPAS